MNNININVLNQPVNIGNLQLKNCSVMAPMTRQKSPENKPTDEIIKYYEDRAAGNIGLIITEGLPIAHESSAGYLNVPTLHSESSKDKWIKLTNRIHDKKSKIFAQLWHVGSIAQQDYYTQNPQQKYLAPSALKHPYLSFELIPEALSTKQIDELISAYTASALLAQRYQFDGVEIHAAHGYLIDQFMWEKTNLRNDKYGKQKALLACEIIKSIKSSCGKDFPISLRFSQWKLGDYEAKLAHTPNELEALLTPIALSGVDLFHCSTRRFYEPEFSCSPLNLAAWTKKITNIKTIAVGSIGLDNDFINTLKNNEQCKFTTKYLHQLISDIESKHYDLFAMGRALLKDSSFFKKLSSD